MGLLGFERAPTTPKHLLSNPDCKTLEKRIGRRRSNLSTLSSIKEAYMCCNNALPKGARAFIQVGRSRAKQLLPMDRKHLEEAGGSS